MVKSLLTDPGDAGGIPESGRPPRVGSGNPLQYSCLENSMDRRAWWAAVHRMRRVGHDLVTENRLIYLDVL